MALKPLFALLSDFVPLLGFWWVTDAGSYYAVATLVGFAFMTGSLILLDLAARLVPIPVATTVFAVIMARASLGTSFGEGVGGYLYDAALGNYGPTGAYRITLIAGAAAISSCWAWVPRLRRELVATA